ncbi:hypothetical protein B0A50_03597 [Salinomyces thailandicus]|uniref:Uncharacterized protein n=1 Tax=Salinomyces thailandicus TaxID=706561 RepID=A0A4U0U437_9PEZI|nr:hypothetical protein B0A50_03597 [Salinomyces thailandica]
MPRSSRQARYDSLLMPENAYDRLNPHPQTQTSYDYPFSPQTVTLALLACLISGFIALALGHYRASVVCHFAFLTPGIIVAVAIHPKVVRIRERMVETPMGMQTVSVHRPLFGRKKCETLYGVTGGYAATEVFDGIWGQRSLVRSEPAMWIVDW